MNQQMPPNIKDTVANIYGAGMKVMYDPKMIPMLKQGLMGNAPMPVKIAMQIAGLIKVLDDKTKYTLPKQAIIPAAMLLLQNLASFVQSAFGIKFSDQDMIESMQTCVKLLMAEYEYMSQQDLAQQSAPPQQQAQPQQTGIIAGAQ